VACLVLAFGRLPAQLVDQAAALDGRAGVAGQGLQQRQVLAAEAAVAGAVGDQQRADRAGGAAQRHHQRVADAVLDQRQPQPVVHRAGVQQRAVAGEAAAQQGEGGRLVGHRRGLLGRRGPEHRPDPGPLPGEQLELGPFGPQQVTGLGEDGGGDHRARLLRAADDPAEPVQRSSHSCCSRREA
jgi:hypothetical protein